jgi:hypothetical protein
VNEIFTILMPFYEMRNFPIALTEGVNLLCLPTYFMFGTLSAGVTIFSTLGSLAKGTGKPGWNKRAGMSKSDWEWEVTLYYFSAVMVVILCALKIAIETGMVDDQVIELALPALDLLFKHDVGHFVLFFWNLFHIIHMFMD